MTPNVSSAPIDFRDRIKELRRVPASELRLNSKNWRVHPEEQRNVLREVLASIGIAGVALVYEDPEDGALVLVDGEMRSEELGERPIPVVVTDLTPEEADDLLAYYDAIGRLAKVDPVRADTLLAGLAERGRTKIADLLGAVSQHDTSATLLAAMTNRHATDFLQTLFAGGSEGEGDGLDAPYGADAAEHGFLDGEVGAPGEGEDDGEDGDGDAPEGIHYVQLAFALTPDQRSIVNNALKLARAHFGVKTSIEALVALADDFRARTA